MKPAGITITKASGEKVAFDGQKLRHSLKRARANEDIIEEVIREVEKLLYTGISTNEIYRLAFSMLRKKSKHSAARYKLKRAIMELGPSGFPFERFVGEILKHQGYSVQVGTIVKGNCVNHEIDVIAEKENHHYMIECKFHNASGYTCDVKIPLYIQARFKDVEHEWKNIPGHGIKFHQGWVVTNTKFTADAIQYGQCSGLYLLGWNYPAAKSLRELIDETGLHPLTCLTTLTRIEKQLLLDKKIVLCKELCDNPSLLSAINVSQKRWQSILQESNQLCEEYSHE